MQNDILQTLANFIIKTQKRTINKYKASKMALIFELAWLSEITPFLTEKKPSSSLLITTR